ncbi:MAG: hypothetical protein A2085_07480 [Gemmatimonadetes bacterium GWC2_71_10]|nr:MAG: hypothetical protein A2085_07480 [Gemmatimonadetes bacterium GWC2_71_10]
MIRVSLLALTLATVHAAVLGAQEFQPPGGTTSGTPSGMRFGILGFSTRAGAQLNEGVQGVLGSTVDVAQLWSPQVRLRPSFEVGFGRADKSLHLALEVVYRFQPDDAPSVPYVGAGLGYYDAGNDSVGVKVWPNLVMGFELPFRSTFNWLVEYHALDRLGRHRFLVGLATRGGTGGQ